jgi:hypothetical protein
MKALTSLCKAERPLENGLHNNFKNSLTVSIYTKQNPFLLLDTSVFDITFIEHDIAKILRAFVLTDKEKISIIDMCDRLVSVKISDIKAGSKYLATKKYYMTMLAPHNLGSSNVLEYYNNMRFSWVLIV